MKLSKETLTVLENFASINQGIEFKKGKTITTISGGKTVLAKANLKDDIPETFCIYDLNNFLSVYNLNKDTEIDFKDADIILKSGRIKQTYRKTDKTMIVTPPEKMLNLPSVEVSFTFTEEDYASTMKAARVMQLPHIAIESDGDDVFVKAFDAAGKILNTSSIRVADGDGKKYKVVFFTDNFKMIPGSYDVEVSFKGLASFKNQSLDIQYWVAVEAKESKFGE